MSSFMIRDFLTVTSGQTLQAQLQRSSMAVYGSSKRPVRHPPVIDALRTSWEGLLRKASS